MHRVQTVRVCTCYFYKKFFWRCLNINRGSQTNKANRINQEIQAKSALVINEKNEKLGIISINVALDQANAKNLDLVQVAPEVKMKDGGLKPAVCKMMDYGKYCYEQDKKDKESKKNQKIVTIKEIRISVNIADNDFQTKANRAIGFLQEGKRVKVSVRFRGRENSNPSRGFDILNKFSDSCRSISNAANAPKLEGRSAYLFLDPISGCCPNQNNDDESLRNAENANGNSLLS